MNNKSNIEQRKKKLDVQIEQFESKGYRKVDISISGEEANKKATIITVIPALILLVLFGIIFGWEKYLELNTVILIISLLASIFIHELIHALFFGLLAPNHFKFIEFGVMWKSLNPYCFCGDPMKRVQYLITLLMPGTILGFVTVILAFCFINPTILLIGAANIMFAGGDFFVAYMILKDITKGKEKLYLDHSERVGPIILILD